MFPGESADAALAAIHAAFAAPVRFTRAEDGHTTEALPAVRSDRTEEFGSDYGRTTRRVIFEIRQSALLVEPRKGDQISDGNKIWRVIQCIARDDVAAWECTVERADGAQA